VLAQGVTLAFAFLIRFVFVDTVVYGTAPSRYVAYVSHVVRRSARPGTPQTSPVMEEAA
jgi:hypothetical protein